MLTSFDELRPDLRQEPGQVEKMLDLLWSRGPTAGTQMTQKIAKTLARARPPALMEMRAPADKPGAPGLSWPPSIRECEP